MASGFSRAALGHQVPANVTFQDVDAVLRAIAHLDREPVIEGYDNGDDHDMETQDDELEDDRVQLDGQWYPLDLVRHILLAHPEALEQLHERGGPTKWLDFPQGRPGPDDLPPDQPEVDELLANRVRSAQQTALHLAEIVKRQQQPEAPPLPLDLAAGVERTLAGVAQSLRSAMPDELRLEPTATLRVSIKDDRWEGQWDRSSRIIDLRQLFWQEAQSQANLDAAVADRLAFAVWQELHNGNAVVPGFRAGSKNGNHVELIWLSPLLALRRS